MNQRHVKILEAVIDMYVKDAEPVSSGQLAQHLDQTLSPATIRNILGELEEMGYLEQPHTSAGRVPTDLGYRFYVNRLQARDLSRQEQKKIVAEYAAGTRAGAARSRQLARILAQRAHTLAVSGWDQEIHEAGLSQVLNTADPADVLREISNFLDQLDSALTELSQAAPDRAAVYIGRENPFFDTEHTSLIIRTIKHPRGSLVLLLVGPKRMRYAKNVSLLNGIAQIAGTL